MSAITVRNLPPRVRKAILEKARKERLSLNKAVVRLLEEATGAGATEAKRPLNHDLDHYAGTWSKEEYDEFMRSLAEQRAIEPKPA
jgi:hypothetical protein